MAVDGDRWYTRETVMFAGETVREVRDVKMKPVTVEELTHKFVLVSLLGDCLLCNAFGD